MNQAFTKADRLLKTLDFQSTFNQGKRVSCAYFTMVGTKSAAGDLAARLGLVVSRKVGKANSRNLVKRRIREIFRAHKHYFSGLDIVIVARKVATSASFSDLANALENCLTQLNLRLRRTM